MQRRSHILFLTLIVLALVAEPGSTQATRTGPAAGAAQSSGSADWRAYSGTNANGMIGTPSGIG